jgi:transposase
MSDALEDRVLKAVARHRPSSNHPVWTEPYPRRVRAVLNGVTAAWQGKELLRAVYATSDLASARAALDRFYHWSDGVQLLELSRLARTVRAWQIEILAWHQTTGCSNGPTEAINLLIKNVKRVGHGLRNLANDRLRLLLHCGLRWQTHPTARLRGRSPRSVA